MNNDVGERTGLTTDRVYQVLNRCLHNPVEIGDGNKPDGCVEVKGVVTNFEFNSKMLKQEEAEINQLLSEIPEEFKQGWTFLNLCFDKNGYQWTDLQQTMEALMALGIAIGKIEYLLPRELWPVMPGGVPYIIIKD